MVIEPTVSSREIGSCPLRPLHRIPKSTSSYSGKRGVNTYLAECFNSVLNVKALVDAFNQENTLVGAFSLIVDRCSSSKHSGPIIKSGASAAQKLIELG